jgi:hypothetical protein
VEAMTKTIEVASAVSKRVIKENDSQQRQQPKNALFSSVSSFLELNKKILCG